MRKSTPIFVATAAALLASASNASAAITTLTFEGVGNMTSVGNFYAAQGIVFPSGSLALIDAEQGGVGNHANEPSPSTVLFFYDGNNAVVNYAAGFTAGFSFFYSSIINASVNVYDGIGGTGNLLAVIPLYAQYNSNNCVGDPYGQACNWTEAGASFVGTARSIDFGVAEDFVIFDNVTFGSATPGIVPEPASWAMLIAGFGLVGAAMRRRRSTTVAV